MPATPNDPQRDREVTSSALLFERRNWHFTVMVIALLAFLVIAPFLVLFDDTPRKNHFGFRRLTAEVGAVYAPFGAVVVFVLLLRYGFASMRCYERGLCYSTLLRKRCFRYEDIAAFTFGPERDEDGSVQHEDMIEFVLEPHGAVRRDFVKFRDSIKTNPKGMRLVRNAVARAMAVPLAERVANGGRLSWTSLLCFEYDRVIYDFSEEAERSISVRDIDFIDFAADTALVYIVGRREPQVQLVTRIRNFYPGLFCLELLRERYGAPPVFTVDDDGELLPPS